jgi:hypothetical protein
MCLYCNYGFVSAKVCCDFWSVVLLLLLMMIILVFCGFNRTIRTVHAYLLFMRFWLFVSSLLDLSRHESVGP